MPVEKSLAGEFDFASAREGHYRREISEGWRNGTERIFGGYTAALALSAALRSGGEQALAKSAHVVFLDAVMPGEVRFEVRNVKAGKSVIAMDVSGFQGDKQAISAQFWMERRPPADAAPAVPGYGERPSDGVGIDWLAPWLPFHHWLECRRLDYPESKQAFIEGDDRRTLDLWVRSRAQDMPDARHGQMFDLLVADTFTADSHARARGIDPNKMVTLDLSLHWTPHAGRAGWRRIQGSSPEGNARSAVTQTSLSDETGHVCAFVLQQTWMLP